MVKTGRDTDDNCRESYISDNNVSGYLKEILEYHECDLGKGDKLQEMKMYCDLGNGCYTHGDFKNAIHYHQRCLEIARKLGDVWSEGRACGNLGSDYGRLGDYEKAIHYHQRCLEIARKVGNVSNEGAAYGNLGNDYQKLGDFKKAIHYHERHLEIARKVRNVSSEGIAYCNLGNDYYKLGDFQKAIRYHESCLEIARKVGDVSCEGAAYGYLGNDYYKLGDFQKAIRYHESCLEIARKVGDVATEGGAYCNLGSDYEKLADFKKAIHYHERGLEIVRKVGNVSDEGQAYGNLGIDYQRLGYFKKAIHYNERSMEIARKVGNVLSEEAACFTLGSNYLSLGDFKKAILYLDRCLEIARKVGDVYYEGQVYGMLGDAYKELGAFRKAMRYHERCLEMTRKVGSALCKGLAYCRLASDYLILRDFQNAVCYFERGLEIATEVGDKLSICGCFCGLGLAFESMGCLSEGVDCYRHGITAFNDVRRNLAFHDDWKVSLRNLYQMAYAKLWPLLLRQGKIEEALLSAEQGRAQALNDLLEFKYGSKQYRAESSTEMKPTADILNASVSTSSTVFLALERQEVIFWVLQKGKDVQLRRKQIPDGEVDAKTFLHTTTKKIRGRVVVECEDRSLNMTSDETLADERPPSDERHNQSFNIWNSTLRLLYETLISPIQDLLLDSEVIFVPEGPLCLTPFAAFMESDSKYLCESFRVRVIPSLTSLKLIADCPADYHIKSRALLVGDPWIQEVTFEGTTLKQLPFARQEVQMIGRILRTTPLVGEHATKNEVLKQLSSVALVHIAAHGRMETGEIALAPNPSLVSRTPVEEDFVLTMRDVLNVQMRARLVVLSCCHIARGEIKAEGVVGIARAFLGAGARSVLVSLWAVDDKATMEFMKIFYQHLMKGESASAAHNQAMKSMRESDEFSEVKYWAPFVLIGDDFTLELGGQE